MVVSSCVGSSHTLHLFYLLIEGVSLSESAAEKGDIKQETGGGAALFTHHVSPVGLGGGGVL